MKIALHYIFIPPKKVDFIRPLAGIRFTYTQVTKDWPLFLCWKFEINIIQEKNRYTTTHTFEFVEEQNDEKKRSKTFGFSQCSQGKCFWERAMWIIIFYWMYNKVTKHHHWCKYWLAFYYARSGEEYYGLWKIYK